MVKINKNKSSKIIQKSISRSERWERRFQELLIFKKNHNHCNVPERWNENRDLSNWVFDQRRLDRRAKLSPERFQRLIKIGFKFNLREANWEKRYSALQNFKKQHGHCNVPDEWSESPRLAQWVKSQRAKFKRGNLDQEHFDRLQKIGFVWQLFDARWEAMFARLVQYKDMFGHCNVPRKWIEDPQLGTWVAMQRNRRKKGMLKNLRIKRLNGIGFQWTVD